MKFQQAFIKWVQNDHVNEERPAYLGGADEDVTACIKVCANDPSTDVDSLKNTHEEADDRMMFYIHQAVTKDDIEKIIIASRDTIYAQSTTTVVGFIAAGKSCGLSAEKEMQKQFYPFTI